MYKFDHFGCRRRFDCHHKAAILFETLIQDGQRCMLDSVKPFTILLRYRIHRRKTDRHRIHKLRSPFHAVVQMWAGGKARRSHRSDQLALLYLYTGADTLSDTVQVAIIGFVGTVMSDAHMVAVAVYSTGEADSSTG